MYDGKTDLPKDKSIFYIISKDGIYLYKDLNTIRSLTKVNAISFLKEIEGFAELKIPLIPKEIIAQAVGFLRWVYQHCKSEGGLILHLYPETGKYELTCPKQEVSSGSVAWDNKNESIPQGAIRICSIHSHGGGSAFHSSIDKDDEKNFDGFHITFGNMDSEAHSIVASIVVNGNRFKLDEKQISEYLDIRIIPVEGGDKIQIVQQEQPCRIYEDYQPTVGKYSLCDITLPINPNLKKWEGYTITKNGCIGDERRFLLDVGLSDYQFPCEWEGKVNYKAPKVYRWDQKTSKFVEYESVYSGGGYYGGGGYRGKEYDWSDWYENHNDETSKYPLINNPSYSKNDNMTYLQPSDKDIDLYPAHGNCNICIYKEIARDAMDQGLIEEDEIISYLNDGFIESSIDPIGMNDIPENDEYYGCHSDNLKDFDEFNIHYDEKGNMVNSEGDIIKIIREEQDRK
jgi:hypothetical protein